MLYRIILKNFKYYLKDSILFFVSIFLAVTELVVFWGFKNIGKRLFADFMMTISIYTDFLIAGGIIAAVAVLLIFFSMKNYIYRRLSDYTVFLTFGMKRKQLNRIIGFEYGIGCLGSLVLGTLAGQMILCLAIQCLHTVYPGLVTIQKIGFDVYGQVYFLVLVILLGGYAVLMTWLDGKNLSTLMMKNSRAEWRPKSQLWTLLLLIGVVSVLAGIHLQQADDFTWDFVYAHGFWLAGILILLVSGLSLALNILKKKKKFYIRHLLFVNQVYYRYQSNLMILLILVSIHFFALTYLTTEAARILPLNSSEVYPYDAICFASEENREQEEKITEKYEGTVKTIPMIRVASYWAQGAEIGISESEYEKLTGKSFDLADREIVVEQQNMDANPECQVTDTEEFYNVLYTGRNIEKVATDLMWTVNHTKNIHFQVCKIFIGRTIGKYSENKFEEDIIVFSDQYFDKQWEQAQKNGNEITELLLLTFPENKRDAACVELKAYTEQYGITFKMQSYESNSFYSTGDFLQKKLLHNLFKVGGDLFLLAVFVITAIYAMEVKSSTERMKLVSKSEFFRCMGMKRKQRLKQIRFEIEILPGLALLLNLMAGVVYAYAAAFRSKGMMNLSRYWKYWTLIFGVYILINMIFVGLFSWCIARNIERNL